MANNIITRFAPSPTGYLHIGGARSALFNYIFTKQNAGKIILRIEDTDQDRNKDEYTKGIIEAFDWLSIKFDKIHKQSENFPVHRKYLEKLIASGHAYISREDVKEEGLRSEVVRFKNENKDIIINDLIKGDVKFNTTELNDFVIAKSLDEPIFHLSNVVDDIISGVTHIIRGEEHLSNTPRQILIWEAIGEVPRPAYGHIPLILSEQKEKISKRKHGEIVSVEYYKRNGYLPEALLNFLALLGWNPGGDAEILSIDDMISKFSLKKVQKAGAIFNQEKLLWFNRQYLRKLGESEFIERALSFLPEWLSTRDDIFKRLLPLLRDKTYKFSDLTQLFIAGNELFFVKELPEYESNMLLWKKMPNKKIAHEHLLKVIDFFDGIDENDFATDNIRNVIWSYAEEKGRGDVLWPLRVALTGQERSPDPFMSAYILGKTESIARIQKACAKLE